MKAVLFGYGLGGIIAAADRINERSHQPWLACSERRDCGDDVLCDFCLQQFFFGIDWVERHNAIDAATAVRHFVTD
jgi:hypothetical protein